LFVCQFTFQLFVAPDWSGQIRDGHSGQESCELTNSSNICNKALIQGVSSFMQMMAAGITAVFQTGLILLTCAIFVPYSLRRAGV
jgi:hypothetical protein